MVRGRLRNLHLDSCWPIGSALDSGREESSEDPISTCKVQIPPLLSIFEHFLQFNAVVTVLRAGLKTFLCAFHSCVLGRNSGKRLEFRPVVQQ